MTKEQVAPCLGKFGSVRFGGGAAPMNIYAQLTGTITQVDDQWIRVVPAPQISGDVVLETPQQLVEITTIESIVTNG